MKIEEKKVSPCGAGKKHDKSHPDCNCGRPKEKLENLEKEWDAKLKKDWTTAVLSEYEQGAADIEIRVMLGISNDLWGRLMKEEAKFSETIEYGRALSNAWWVKTGRVNLNNKDFSAPLFKINMANRFNWREKQDHTTDDKPIEGVQVVFKKPE